MNSELLGDILECSVCLKPLDEQNKVLPCQHTFCKSCLQSIVKSHKELRCPECRVIVKQRVDDLPSNILLIRLLDGIKNQTQIIDSFKSDTRRHSIEGILSEPIPASGGAKDGGSSEVFPFVHERTGSEPASNKVKVSVTRPHACALYSYQCDEPNDLSFNKGDIIYLLKQVDKHWMNGECNGKSGVFPVNHVKILQPLPSERPYCVALYDFESDPRKPDRDCLHFAKNDRILVIRKVDDNWAEGVLKEKIGIFPLSFVKLNEEAQKIVNESFFSSPGFSDDLKPQRSGISGAASRRISSSKHGGKNTKKRHSFPTFQAVKNKDDSSSSSSYRHSVDFESTSLSVENGGSPPNTSNSFELTDTQDGDSAAKAEFVNSLTQKLEPLVSTSASLPSSSVAGIAAARDGESKITEKSKLTEKQDAVSRSTVFFTSLSKGTSSKLVTAAFTYKSQKPDELNLVRGDSYQVAEVCRDGWCRGSHLKSGKSGVFPGNYITPKPALLTVSKSSPNTPRSHDKSPVSSEHSTLKTERTYKQFRQLQLKLLQGRDSSKLENGRSAAPPNLLNPQNALKPQKSTISASKSGGSVFRTSPEAVPQSSGRVRCSSANPSLNTENRSPTAHTPSISPPPPRPAPPDSKLLASRFPRSIPHPNILSIPHPNTEFVRPVLNQSLSFDGKTPSPSTSSHRVQHKETRKPSEKDKKRSKGMLSKVLSSAASSAKPKATVSKSLSSPTSSPPSSGRNKHSFHKAALHQQSKPIVKPLPRDRYYATMNYPASDPEELELKTNDIVIVHSRRPDGWFKGSNLRSGLVGHFPSTFVERIPQKN